MGAGCGVMSCELATVYPQATFHCVEVQRAFEPFLTANLEESLKHRSVVSFEAVSTFNLSGFLKFDLILFNPPYFNQKSTRPSPIHEREIARKLIVGTWEDWSQCVERSLGPQGSVYWVHRFERTLGDEFKISKIAERGDLGIWSARRLHVE